MASEGDALPRPDSRVWQVAGNLTWGVLRRWVGLALVTLIVLALAPSAPGFALLTLVLGAVLLVAWQVTRT